jgi:hypothetical protein
MTIGISAGLRDDRLQILLDAIDAASDEYGSAHLLIYSGDRPDTGEVPDEYENILLLDYTLPFPCGSITDGVLTFSAIDTVDGLDYGIAIWARITDADDIFVMDLSVTSNLGSGDVKMDSTEVFEGTPVNCTLATITEGNP